MNDELLIKYLLKETSEDENILVKRWLEAHPDHQKEYEQMKWVWDRSKDSLQSSEVDENLAWEKFKTKRDQRSGSLRLLPVWMRAVAAVFTIMVIGWLALSFLPPGGRAYFAEVVLEAGDSTQKEILLDGTLVTLNKNSRLSYSQKMFTGERRVRLLEGEAYFEVKRDEDTPFYLQSDDLEIKVLGTSFNVKKQGDYTDVVLDEGSIAVQIGDQALTLEPGQRVSVHGKDKSLEKSTVENRLHRYYLNSKFEAENIPLYQIVEALNAAYGANITIASEGLANRKITTTLEYGSLDQNLEVIKETLGISISGEDKESVLH